MTLNRGRQNICVHIQPKKFASEREYSNFVCKAQLKYDCGQIQYYLFSQ